nr:hypothetical protein [Saccharopolyspora sp. HNM0983]
MVTAAIELALGGGFRSVLTGWSGALLGTIALPLSLQLGLLVGAVLFGLRVRAVVLGATKLVWSGTVGRITLTVRALPVAMSAAIGPWRAPVFLRCWLAGLVSACCGAALVGTAWLLASGPFGRGLALAGTAFLLYKLWPRRVPFTTSTGWLLFALPRMPEPARTEFRISPLATSAREAVMSGELDRAAEVTDRIAALHPDSDAALTCRVAVLEARGDYAAAVLMLLNRMSQAELAPREMSYRLAGLAGLGFAAVEAEQLPAEDLLPVARKAMHDATALGYPEFELAGTRGLLALLDGDPDEAVRLAATGAEHGNTALSRADDYATIARAHMARHDNAAARQALAEAERLAPWWPRVVETRERLSVT